MNQRQLQAFLMVMRHGSITAAAHALNISQPAVSRLIADLEESAGFSLLERQGGKARPTPEAREFIQEVERMFYSLDRMAQVAREIKDLRRASLQIATMPMVTFDIVPRALDAFLAAHPGVKITHNVHTSDRIVDLVSSQQIDLGIGQTRADRRDVEILASFRMLCVCALAPDHPLAGRAELTPADLADTPLVALAHHTMTANYVTRSFAEARVAPNIAVESQPSYSACGLAAVGLGVTIVDPLTPLVFGERLKTVPFKPDIPFDFHVLKPAEQPLTRAARLFCDVLFEVLDNMREARQLPS